MMDAKEAAAKAADAFVMACGDTRGYFEDVVVHALRARDAEHEAERKRLEARERELVDALQYIATAECQYLRQSDWCRCWHCAARAAIAAPQTEKEQPA